ncbi:transcription termination factor MTERF6, chloroplastic/mitochondrial-like [Pyrus communis]|uniref:transcription termination factor MTERF6, chloroplastic/mitochondrial-like n=1 Tax=Pyrus communis TaxID=23211 RepID=UPI0035BED1B5
MVGLYKLKAVTLLRLGYPQSSSSSVVASTFERLVVGDAKPSHFPLQNLLLCRHFTSEISEIHHDFTVNYLINSCGLSPEGAILSSKWVKLRSLKTADSVLSFLRNHGFSETQISKMVRARPILLKSSPEKTLLPKLEFFASIGVSKEHLAKTLTFEPKLLSLSLDNRIAPTYDFLRSLLSQKNVVFVLRRGSWIFAEGHSKNVAPKIEVLKKLGMPQSSISLLLTYHPNTLQLKLKELGELVDEVKQMGFDLQNSTSVKAIHALGGSNRSVWNRCREVYKRWGWSEDDVLSAFKRQPQCMIVSEKKLMRTLEFLVKEMGWSSKTIVKTPLVLCFSFEKRLVPRCSVVKALLLKGLINGIENVGLRSLLEPADKCFLERFVARYIDEVPQLLSVYQGRVAVQDV